MNAFASFLAEKLSHAARAAAVESFLPAAQLRTEAARQRSHDAAMRRFQNILASVKTTFVHQMGAA